VTYYAQSRSLPRLAECYFLLNDYPALTSLVASLPETSPLLITIAEYFASLGMCDAAADAYVKSGNLKKAIAVCIRLNAWGRAISLGAGRAELDGLVGGGDVASVELYRKAGLKMNAAVVLYMVFHMFFYYKDRKRGVTRWQERHGG
jgi:WD repeat-containing protein 35